MTIIVAGHLLPLTMIVHRHWLTFLIIPGTREFQCSGSDLFVYASVVVEKSSKSTFRAGLELTVWLRLASKSLQFS